MNLKVLRVMAHLTQAEAAERVGVSQGVVSDWERGQYKPSAASVSRLAEVYGVSVREILKGIELAIAARGGADGQGTECASRFGRPGYRGVTVDELLEKKGG